MAQCLISALRTTPIRVSMSLSLVSYRVKAMLGHGAGPTACSASATKHWAHMMLRMSSPRLHTHQTHTKHTVLSSRLMARPQSMPIRGMCLCMCSVVNQQQQLLKKVAVAGVRHKKLRAVSSPPTCQQHSKHGASARGGGRPVCW